jgi:hypothetical protein
MMNSLFWINEIGKATWTIYRFQWSKILHSVDPVNSAVIGSTLLVSVVPTPYLDGSKIYSYIPWVRKTILSITLIAMDLIPISFRCPDLNRQLQDTV